MESSPTAQELQKFYDDTIIALLKQGHRAGIPDEASTGGFRCLYRAPNGDKCAAGHHIPDSLYHPQMEDSRIWIVLQDFPEVKPYFPNLQLAESLQTFHDEPENWSKAGGFSEIGKDAARAIARNYGLVPFNFDK